MYSTRNDAKTEIFKFIEMFYNPIKRHSHTGGVSPVRFEENYFSKLKVSTEIWEVQASKYERKVLYSRI